jgi:hypothetical protein
MCITQLDNLIMDKLSKVTSRSDPPGLVLGLPISRRSSSTVSKRNQLPQIIITTAAMDKPTTPSGKSLDTLPEFRDSDCAGPSSSAPVLLDVDPSAVAEELPAYSEDPTYLGEEPPAFSTYAAQQHVIGNGQVISHDLHLNSDVEALYQWLHSCAQTEPRPLLAIEGWHRKRKSKGGHRHVTDFYLTFDLSSFLKEGYELHPAAPLQRRRRGTRAKREATDGEVEAAIDVRGWCDAYIRNPARLKEFMLHKRLEGLDQEMIQTYVTRLVRSTNYRGRVEIRFPMQKRSVVLSPDNWVCRVRYGWARWLFYLSFLWILTWPVLLVFTKRWDVVDAFYQCETNVQREWVDRWGWVITRLVLRRRHQYAPLTVANLRWLECRELEDQQRREARRGTGFWGRLRSLGDGVGGGSWGHDEW